MDAHTNGLIDKPGWKWIPHYIESNKTLTKYVHSYHVSVLQGKKFEFGVEIPKTPPVLLPLLTSSITKRYGNLQHKRILIKLFMNSPPSSPLLMMTLLQLTTNVFPIISYMPAKLMDDEKPVLLLMATDHLQSTRKIVSLQLYQLKLSAWDSLLPKCTS